MPKRGTPIPSGFSLEERRLRVRLMEMGLRQKDVAQALGIASQDVNMVIRGRSTCPMYVAEVYKYLGLERQLVDRAI